MARYPIRIDSTANFRADLIAAMTAAGVLTTVHLNTGSDLIVTTTLSNKVLRFNLAGAGYHQRLWIGDVWVSGTTITNPVAITEHTAVADGMHLVIRGGVLVLASKNTTIRAITSIIGKTKGGTEKLFAIGAAIGTTANDYHARNTSDDADFDMGGLRQTGLRTTNGRYLSSELLSASSGLVIGEAIHDLKAIYRGNAVVDYCAVVGNDVLINFGFSKNTVNYMPHQLLIPNGML